MMRRLKRPGMVALPPGVGIVGGKEGGDGRSSLLNQEVRKGGTLAYTAPSSATRDFYPFALLKTW